MTMDTLAMEIREVSPSQRLVVGTVAPYDEISYLTPHPRGERVLRRAFARSIQHRAAKIPLLKNHDISARMGTSRRFDETAEGLVGEFVVNRGDVGDRLLEDARDGYLGSMSASWIPLVAERAADGIREVAEAKLVEVSLVAVPAYEGAGLLAVRNAQHVEDLAAPFRIPRPEVNLDPLPPILYRPHR